MIIDKNENTTIITQDNSSVKTLVSQIEADYALFKDHHLIIILSSLETTNLEDIITFLRLSNTHRADKKSFVIVSNSVDLDDMPDEIVVVPTLQEAHDIIEMEAMERDLGF